MLKNGAHIACAPCSIPSALFAQFDLTKHNSSGEKVARGGITKTGNSATRRALVEAAWHFASCSPEPKPPRAGCEGVPADIERRCAKCTARLASRHRALREAGKRPCVANVAVARELACWVWEVGCRAEGTLR